MDEELRVHGTCPADVDADDLDWIDEIAETGEMLEEAEEAQASSREYIDRTDARPNENTLTAQTLGLT